MKLCGSLVLSLALCACASERDDAAVLAESLAVFEAYFVPADQYELSTSLNAEAQRFDVTLTSRSAEPLCLQVGQWPNHLGQMDTGSQQTRLTIGDRLFTAANRNFGNCMGDYGCTLKLDAGEKLTGFVAFSEFETWDGNLDQFTSFEIFAHPSACAPREMPR